MPLCGEPTKSGEPCRNKVSACWRHRSLWANIKQNKTLSFALTAAGLCLGLTGAPSWHGVVAYFEPQPITKPMLEALREQPSQPAEHLHTTDSVSVQIHRAGTK